MPDGFAIGDPDEAGEAGTDGDSDTDVDSDTDSDSDTDRDADIHWDRYLDDGRDGDRDVDQETDADETDDADQVCVPRCDGRECGNDGCRGLCPPGCDPHEVCDDEGRCQCVRNCGGRECGTDGCGGFCPPGCDIGELCDTEDGTCARDCTRNSRWGAACGGTTNCDDGSPCVSVRGLAAYGSICSPICDTDSDCYDISPGVEMCGTSLMGPPNCIVICAEDSDCPCGMSCRRASGGTDLCYP